MSEEKDKDSKDKDVEEALRKDAREGEPDTDPDALTKIQEKIRRRSGNGKKP